MQTQRRRTIIALPLHFWLTSALLGSALLLGACSSASENAAPTATVVSSTPPPTVAPATETAPPATAATAAAVVGSTPVTAATPVAGQPAPVGQDATKTGNIRHLGDIPAELSPAKAPPTPMPDPFPPRPTPPVVMENGKIKQQWQAPPEALALTNPYQATPANIAEGRTFFEERCADCHGRSGRGNGPMSAMTKREGESLPATNLVSQVVQANTDGELFWKITNGRSPMPANRVRFSDEQRWKMVLYLRTLK